MQNKQQLSKSTWNLFAINKNLHLCWTVPVGGRGGVGTVEAASQIQITNMEL